MDGNGNLLAEPLESVHNVGIRWAGQNEHDSQAKTPTALDAPWETGEADVVNL